MGDTYVSELFPTRVRGNGFGLAVGGGRFVTIFAPVLVGAGIAAFGPTVPFLASAGLWVLTIVGYALGPEAHRKSLEQIEAELESERHRPSRRGRRRATAWRDAAGTAGAQE